MGGAIGIGAGNDFLTVLIYLSRHDSAADFAELVDRLIPKSHVALGVGIAAVEDAAALASPLYHMAFVAFRAHDAGIDDDGFVRIAGGAFQVATIGALAIDHEGAAVVTFHVGHFFGAFGQAVRLDVLAVRIVRAGQIFPVATDLHDHLGAAFLTGHIGDFLIFLLIFFRFHIGFGELFGEDIVEAAHDFLVGGFAFGDFIEPSFQVRCEAYIDDAFEIFLQKVRHFEADVGGYELLPIFGHIAALLDGIQNGRVGRRAADAFFFEGLDEAGFGVAGRRRGEVLLAFGFLVHHHLAFSKRRQEIFFLVFLLGGNRKDREAREKHMDAGGFQEIVAALDGGGGALLDLRRHLGGDEAIPNEGIEPHLVAGKHVGQRGRRELQIRRTDGFVGILGVLRLAEDVRLGR